MCAIKSSEIFKLFLIVSNELDLRIWHLLGGVLAYDRALYLGLIVQVQHKLGIRLYLRFVRSNKLLRLKAIPVDISEERMVCNVLSVVCSCAEALLGVAIQQLAKNKAESLLTRVMMSCSLLDISIPWRTGSGKIILPVRISMPSLWWLLFIKGGLPVAISYINIPNVHQSTEKPWPFISKISGAKYSAVPQKLYV